MGATGERLTDKGKQPEARLLSAWLGPVPFGRWGRLLNFIETNYPGVFAPDWIFGGAKHGWALRFKKSKSFCMLIPERKRFQVLIVFGKDEREKAASVLRDLSPAVRRKYEEAKTYHDGKWVVLPVDRDGVLKDICRLLAIKRRPANHQIIPAGR